MHTWIELAMNAFSFFPQVLASNEGGCLKLKASVRLLNQAMDVNKCMMSGGRNSSNVLRSSTRDLPREAPSLLTCKKTHFYSLTSSTSSSSSASFSPSSQISCPLPSYTNPLTIQPHTATPASPHHTPPMIPLLSPRPNSHPPNIGPAVLLALPAD